MTPDLLTPLLPDREPLAEGAVLLRGFASAEAAELIEDVSRITKAAPFRKMITPGGHKMLVSMSNCGTAGWLSDKSGYRYGLHDPATGNLWPSMPVSFARSAARAATAGGFKGFVPDACLINRYDPGTKLSLHQDRDEQDFNEPIVSISLGLPAIFLFGGMQRSDRPQRIPLQSGDVVVWGGPARLTFHGVAPLAKGKHELTGPCRINLTFRKAL